MLIGYVYMNGDIEKIPPGVAFAPTPELVSVTGGGGGNSSSSTTSATTEPAECVVNGVADETVVRASSPMAAGTGGATTSPNTTTTQANNIPDIPLDQLKQMLSSQLEYYFSR